MALCICLFTSNVNAQNAHEYLQDGDDQYNANNYITAEIYYRKAKEKESTLKSNFNLGNATYQQGRYEEAIEYYQNATSKAIDSNTKSDAFYNLGNAYFNNQKLEEAADAFKKAIRENPNNKNARYNLAYTKEMLKQMAQQQQQDQSQQENQDQQNQDQQNQDQQNNQDQQGNNQDQNEKKEEEEQKQEEQKQDSSQQSQPMSFDSSRLDKQSLDSIDAQNLLKIIQDEEMKVQEKLRKFNSKRKKPDKDW